MKTAEEIVRALAGADAPTKETVASGERCALCGGALVWGFPQPDVLHAPDCPYRMAREWVDRGNNVAVLGHEDICREIHFRRGFQQGALSALRLLEGGLLLTRIKDWAASALNRWRFDFSAKHDPEGEIADWGFDKPGYEHVPSPVRETGQMP